jgi:hypothetical protein
MAKTKKYLKFKKKRGFKIRKSNNIIGATVNRKLETNIAVYAAQLNLGATIGYTLNPNPSSSALSSFLNLLSTTNGFQTTAEFAALAKVYGAVCMKGCSLTFRRNFNNSSSGIWLNLPALYIDLNPYSNVTTSTTAYSSDTRYEIQLMNLDSKPVGKYWSFPDIMGGPQDFMIGKKCWTSVNDLSAGSDYYLSLNISAGAGLANSTTTSNIVQELGRIDAVLYCKYGAPTYYG